MSRPSSSLPSRCPGEPNGSRRFRMAPLNGSAGAMSGAKIAITTTATRTSRQTTVTLSFSSLLNTVFQ